VKSVIQKIFQKHFEAYRTVHNLPLHVVKAMRAVSKCRTAELGGHVLKCPEGHVEQVWYNSCKHRFCPVCSFVEVAKWIHKQVNRLPDCDYYHTIFTLPWELNRLWEYNRQVFTNLLFKAAWETLKQLLADPKYLGAMPGGIGSFHSWTQTMWVHPHVHFLVTGGGMTSAGKWVNTKNDFLLPARVVSAKFRGKFLAFLKKHGDASLHAAKALSEARAGAIIADSEYGVRDAMARFRQKVYQKAVQMKADKAAKAAFSPSAQPPGNVAKGQGPSGSQPPDGQRHDPH